MRGQGRAQSLNGWITRRHRAFCTNGWRGKNTKPGHLGKLLLRWEGTEVPKGGMGGKTASQRS
jgi:hypothetical protein